MGTSFGALCTDFYVNQKLALKMDLPTGRETILDLFDRVRKSCPKMDRFKRYDGELALESTPEDGQYDWLALRRTSVRSGSVNPESLASAYQLHRLVLEITPYFLSVSPLDVDYLEVLFGFDLEARGNHDEIVFDALFSESPLGALVDVEGTTAADVQPYLTLTIDDDRRIQANFEVKTRSAGDRPDGPAEEKFDDEPISIFLSVRQMGPVVSVDDLQGMFERLTTEAERLATDKIVPLFLNPISKAINSRSR